MAVFAIEIADPRNRQVVFPPTNEKLRGRWETANVSGRRFHEYVALMPNVIPGIVLVVDTTARTCMQFDPLGLEEHDSTLRKINHARKANPDITGDQECESWPKVVHEKCTNDMMKTWLFWMRRLLDAPHAITCKFGRIPPTIDEITTKLPGKAFISQFNAMATRKFVFNEEEMPDGVVEVSNEKGKPDIE